MRRVEKPTGKVTLLSTYEVDRDNHIVYSLGVDESGKYYSIEEHEYNIGSAYSVYKDYYILEDSEAEELKRKARMREKAKLKSELNGDTMKEYKWPYIIPSHDEIAAKIALAEEYLQKCGGELIETINKSNKLLRDNDFYETENTSRNIWKYKGKLIRIDTVLFPEKPFLIVEYADGKDGFWYGAAPFPYDLSSEEYEREIRLSLGIDYSEDYPFHFPD